MGLRKLPRRDGALNSGLKVQQEMELRKEDGRKSAKEKKQDEQRLRGESLTWPSWKVLGFRLGS